MYRRLLITGAAGGLGRVMRHRVAGIAAVIRVSDIAEMEPAGDAEEVVQCDLSDAVAVHDLVAGCDGILHLGGISVEDMFPKILRSNIEGVFNLYEAARAHGHPRILFASSNHTVGYHPQTTRLDAQCTLKPDGLYGVSKCFGEAMAAMYHAKFGQETAIVRIGSCLEKPIDHRMLATWLSHGDFAELIRAVFAAPELGCPVIWGASANDDGWWDNAAVGFLGWTPKDNSAAFRAELEATVNRPSADDPRSVWQGGAFTQTSIITDQK